MKTIYTSILEVGDAVYFTMRPERDMLLPEREWIVLAASDLGRDGFQMITISNPNATPTEQRVLVRFVQAWMDKRYEIEEV